MMYKSKKNKISYKKYINNYKFKIIILSSITLSLFLIYLSIPFFYNYDTYDQLLKNKINQDFKINVINIKKIEYKIFPKPHFLVQDSKISLKSDANISKIENFKIYINLKNLHKKNKIQIKKIFINKSNINFKYSDLIYFHDHLQKKITKPIHIHNSNFFYYNEDEKNILISPIKKLKYYIDKKNRKKFLKISGILFGVDYKFSWIKNYNEPKLSESNIKFKNLDLNVNNLFEKYYEKNIFRSKTVIELLNEKIRLNYFVKKEEIEFLNDKENLNFSNLIGKINLNPFFFNLNFSSPETNLESFIEKFFLYLYPLKNNFHENFNGDIKINIKKSNSKYFENLNFKINFYEGKLDFIDAALKLNKIGKINFSDIEYVEKENMLFLRSKLEVSVENQDEFYKRFLVRKEDRVNVSKIYSYIEKNIDKNEYFLGKIYFNNRPKSFTKNNDTNIKFTKIENYHRLSKIIKNELKEINLD